MGKSTEAASLDTDSAEVDAASAEVDAASEAIEGRGGRQRSLEGRRLGRRCCDGPRGDGNKRRRDRGRVEEVGQPRDEPHHRRFESGLEVDVRRVDVDVEHEREEVARRPVLEQLVDNGFVHVTLAGVVYAREVAANRRLVGRLDQAPCHPIRVVGAHRRTRLPFGDVVEHILEGGLDRLLVRLRVRDVRAAGGGIVRRDRNDRLGARQAMDAHSLQRIDTGIELARVRGRGGDGRDAERP